MSWLCELSSAKQALKPTTTTLTTVDGKVVVEQRRGDGGAPTVVQDLGRVAAGFVCDMAPDLQAAEIRPFLLLGAQDVVADRDFAQGLGITHILNVAGSDVIPELFPNDFRYKSLQILDVPETKIEAKFGECFDFVDSAREHSADNRIFVHCNAGVSRSPTVVIAYLMARDRLSLEEALSFVKSKRPCIRPNDGFMQQLVEFERSLNV